MIYRGTYDSQYSENWKSKTKKANWNYPYSKTLLCRRDNNSVMLSGGGYNLRIRRLTPKECFRLMGVKDEDFNKIAKNQSDSSLYHLAGDSIVVNVLVAIFKEVL